MAKIRVLPESAANRIAAGEVVERPASVAKELVENALDADARAIEVRVEEGGGALIEVADDGAGMDAEDARLAFARHATSKIRDADDILRVATFGFRGEALPSIASVAEVELLTAPEGGEGTRLVLRAGRLIREEKAARARGTTIAVRNLFFNTPARRKFLKSEPTEEKRIRRAVIAQALSERDVAFRYLRDGEEVFHLPAGEDLRLRLARLFGRPFADELVLAEGKEHGPVVFGFVSKIDAARGTRDYQFFHVNRRPVQQALLHQAVAAAYQGALPRGRHPAYVLSLTLDPEFVDVNIHPTKREVRFSPERTVFAAVQAAVGRALRSESSLPRLWKEKPETPRTGESRGEPRPLDLPPAREGSWTYHPDSRAVESEPAEAEGEGWLARADLSRVHQIGNTFLVTAAPEGILIADQHTVHERILFEETLARIERRSGESQRLLFPETVEADPDLVRIAEENCETIEAAGFLVHPAGPRGLLLEGTPPGLRTSEPRRFLIDFLESLGETERSDEPREKRVAASVACHGAVRAGDPLAPEERSALLRRLRACHEPLRCPHGRPTFLTVSSEELARRFLRT